MESEDQCSTIRILLDALSLQRAFLVELCNATDRSPPSKRFAEAMRMYRVARDRFVCATWDWLISGKALSAKRGPS